MIPSSKTQDLLIAIFVCLLIVTSVLIVGDSVFFGIWYYFAVFFTTIYIASFFKPIPFFQTGAAIGIAIIFLTYLHINWSSSRPEGLLGLGHLFSLPGAALGLIISAIALKRVNTKMSGAAFLFGLLGILIGFFINQLLVCNTLMWCGLLSIE